jgi:hypothetical protein
MMIALAAPVSSAPAPQTGPDAEAVAALKRMSTYLSGLQSFEITSQTSLDVVTVDNQRLQLDGEVHYKVKRPGIWVELLSDLKTRRYIYDGKQFTIYAPKLGYYASLPAPPTNREFLKTLYDKTGISLPLEDLFRWNDGDDSDLKALTAGFSAGTATLDGVETDHWAFRQGDYDWEVWIDKGDKPLPRKLVIIDRTDPTMPGYTARLKWTVNPPLTDSDFTFAPDSSAKRITLATLAESPK